MSIFTDKLHHASTAIKSLFSGAPATDDLDDAVALGARRVIWILGGAMATFVLWAAVFDLDVASRGVGEVVPAGQVKRIQHLEGGIVSEILVAEGEKVSAGQALMTLEGTASQAETAELKSRLAALNIKMVRLQAQLARQDEVTFPDALERDYPEQVAVARELFHSQRQQLTTSSTGQTHKVSQKRAEIDEMTSRITQLTQRSELLTEQVDISVKLLEEGLTNQYAHLELLKEQSVVAGQLAEAQAGLRRARASLQQEQVMMAAIDVDEDAELRAELDDTRTEHGELSERFKKFADSSRRSTIRSPIDGVVMSLFVVTRGGVVAPGGTVMTLVPGDDRLVVEVKLPVTDVGFVQIGQPARLQLTAAAGRRSPPIEGKVVHVSPDVVTEQDREPYVLVRIAPASDRFSNGGWEYQLRPGSQLSASILTGERSVLAYVVDPFISGAHAAMSEP